MKMIVKRYLTVMARKSKYKATIYIQENADDFIAIRINMINDVNEVYEVKTNPRKRHLNVAFLYE